MYEIDEQWILAEPKNVYHSNKNFPFWEETGKIIGICMEIHKHLGKGFLEAVYKDALEYECKSRMLVYAREKKYEVHYKGIVLPHAFFADFVLFDKVIVEIKAVQEFANEHTAQLINYLAVSKCEVGLLVNFGEESLKFKRFALTK